MKFISIAIFIALMCWHPVGMLILLVAGGAYYDKKQKEKERNESAI